MSVDRHKLNFNILLYLSRPRCKFSSSNSWNVSSHVLPEQRDKISSVAQHRSLVIKCWQQAVIHSLKCFLHYSLCLSITDQNMLSTPVDSQVCVSVCLKVMHSYVDTNEILAVSNYLPNIMVLRIAISFTERKFIYNTSFVIKWIRYLNNLIHD